MDEIIIKALLAGIGISLTTSLLGCFVVWKKMAYFGDSLAHSSLLGVAIGMIIGINSNFSIIITAAIFAATLTYLQNKNLLSTDTLLGILAHSGLAIGMILISTTNNPDFDLHDFLFGDILFILNHEIITIYLICFITYLIMLKNWQKLTLLALSKELATAKNINPQLLQIIFITLITITVAVSIKILGILLITSMLIIPAAAARNISKSPNQMAIYATIFGIISVICGLYLSYNFDTPSGPSIILITTVLFILTLIKNLKNEK